ncbi:hypothetical protein USDA257_c42740 [Sinorhizobium fredii USDA 257]|uniref:Uncharacterized protein n=1 Tax=Sinorhizobium fredii (strain USDA 257) TaxID=1185652 RepID=I3XAA7_SINF2|nr:hypothetical protein USDA257_c42740 [Sinorhizobium fredii USDA 257]
MDELFELVFDDWLPASAVLATIAAAVNRISGIRMAYSFTCHHIQPSSLNLS